MKEDGMTTFKKLNKRGEKKATEIIKKDRKQLRNRENKAFSNPPFPLSSLTKAIVQSRFFP
jgi:hypothetical protein